MTPLVGNVVLRRKRQSTFCECEALASLRHAHLGSFFLDPEDIDQWKINKNNEV